MAADAESWRAVAMVSPRVDRGHRHLEIRSEIFDGEQLVELFHVGNRESRALQMDNRSLSTGSQSDLLSICNPSVTLRGHKRATRTVARDVDS